MGFFDVGSSESESDYENKQWADYSSGTNSAPTVDLTGLDLAKSKMYVTSDISTTDFGAINAAMNYGDKAITSMGYVAESAMNSNLDALSTAGVISANAIAGSLDAMQGAAIVVDNLVGDISSANKDAMLFAQQAAVAAQESTQDALTSAMRAQELAAANMEAAMQASSQAQAASAAAVKQSASDAMQTVVYTSENAMNMLGTISADSLAFARTATDANALLHNTTAAYEQTATLAALDFAANSTKTDSAASMELMIKYGLGGAALFFAIKAWRS